eukprot:c29478_g1_i1 orf=115-306(-)
MCHNRSSQMVLHNYIVTPQQLKGIYFLVIGHSNHMVKECLECYPAYYFYDMHPPSRLLFPQLL